MQLVMFLISRFWSTAVKFFKCFPTSVAAALMSWRDYPRFRPSYSCRPYSCPPYSCRDRFRSNRTDSCLALFMSKPFHAQKGLIHVWPYSCPTLFMPRRPIHVRPCSCPTPFMPRRPIHVRPYSCPTPFMSKRSFSCLTIKRANLRLPDLTYL